MIVELVSGILRRRGVERDPFRLAGMPEAVAPALTPWPLLPMLALLLCASFLLVQLLPVAHFRHPTDRVPGYEVGGDWQLGQHAGVGTGVKTAGLEEQQGQVEDEDVASGGEVFRNSRDRSVHVFLSTDEPDRRPLAVLINSTIVNARHPERIFFHLIVPPVQQYWSKLKELFPDVHLEISRKDFDFDRMQKRIAFRNDSKTRQELTSPYNFVPFYLAQLYGDVDRIVYLDTDTVVQGDIEELVRMDLQGHAVAAVEDCMQRLEIYFNANLLESLRAKYAGQQSWIPADTYDLTTCVFNRGVLVLDTREWRKQKLTEAIEWWMEEYAKSDRPLYSYGLSQPPFLLSVYRDYEKLDVTWNTRGLGRHEFSELERDYMRKTMSKRPKKSPFISPHADSAKILHFNGKFKPWKRERLRLAGENIISLCGHRECADIWWSYLSPSADGILRLDEKFVNLASSI